MFGSFSIESAAAKAANEAAAKEAAPSASPRQSPTNSDSSHASHGRYRNAPSLIRIAAVNALSDPCC